MSILHAGEIGRLDDLLSSIDGDFLTLFRNGVIKRIDVENINDYFGLNVKSTSIAFVDSPYTVLETDKILLIDASNGDVVLNPESLNNVTGRHVIAVKEDSSSNSYIWNASVNGETTATVTIQYTSLDFYGAENATEWRII